MKKWYEGNDVYSIQLNSGKLIELTADELIEIVEDSQLVEDLTIDNTMLQEKVKKIKELLNE